MSQISNCASCGRPMENVADHAPNHPDSSWCSYCSTPSGDLRAFDEQLERMTQWEMRRSGASREVAVDAARAYMRTMPAWRDHPSLSQG